MKKSKKLIWIIVGALILVLACITIVCLLNIKSHKIDDNFTLKDEKITLDLDKQEISLEFMIKNESDEQQTISSISLNVINKDGEYVFYYYKDLDISLDVDETYEMNVSGSVENSNLTTENDIKDVTYTINY